ncbi:hypothetical protein NDU88_002514 [Pleurodeles waltl]|uniref:Uncharacterized protein n=1 Tax=Pleurodeles waltl TaxID=8319 RepID=A0AAV7T2T6_PLEWA|nr:hypothetical protein NDU88_002514 [Pleurodeles waltl]
MRMINCWAVDPIECHASLHSFRGCSTSSELVAGGRAVSVVGPEAVIVGERPVPVNLARRTATAVRFEAVRRRRCGSAAALMSVADP